VHVHARDLRERGFAVLEALVDADGVQRLRRALQGMVEELCPPRLWAKPAVTLSERAVLTSPGLAFGRFLQERPELRPWVLPEPLTDAMQATLGTDMVLELAGAVVSDATRPFFTWHTHIDGVDEGERYLSQSWPDVPSVQRVLTLLYLQDLEPEVGPLYVLPRRAGDPTPPPHDLEDRAWPGMVELRPRAGTLVALDQCTWHAAARMRTDGHRYFVGCYFASANVTSPAWADPNLSWSRSA